MRSLHVCYLWHEAPGHMIWKRGERVVRPHSPASRGSGELLSPAVWTAPENWFWHGFRESGLWLGLLCEQDAFVEQVGVGSAERPPLEYFGRFTWPSTTPLLPCSVSPAVLA